MLLTRRFLSLLLMFFVVDTARAAEGDVPLFNGKALTGWNVHFTEAGPKIEDVWSVKEGGVLHCKGKPIGYIYTEKDYTSYKLKLEWRGVGKPGNSGALLRVTTPPPAGETWPNSIECQLQSNNAGDIWNIGNFPMTVAADRTKGRHTKKLHETNEKPIEGGEWNTYEITLDGPNLELKVNGLVQNRATDCKIMPGKIALQSEGAEIEFRNIVLTPLADKGTGAGAAGGASTPSEGAIAMSLSNGKDLSQWTHYAPEKGVKMEDVWTIEDGVIRCKGQPTGFLKSKRKYKDLELTLDWRWPGAPGNSGVLLRAQEPDAIWPKSLEAQLMHQNAGDIILLGGFKGSAAGEVSRMEGDRIKKLHASNEKPSGEWNTYKIKLQGDTAELWVNGTLQNSAVGIDVVAGTIGLQSEGAPIEFRNIDVIDLSAPANAAAPQEPVKRLEGLQGWHILGKGNWTFKDGVIEGSQPEATKTYTHVVTDKSYKDFKAKLNFKAVKGNSGFYFRVQPADESRMMGIQAEIDEANNVGGLYESYGRNWLSLPDKATVEKYFKPGEWNEMTVEGRGPHILVHVNGQKASEITDPSIRMEGPFALQIHGGQDVHVMFKDIQIEELP